MKKIISVAVFTGVLIFLSCGPSAEEQAKKEKARYDSVMNVRRHDSLAALSAAIMKRVQDSITLSNSKEKDSNAYTNILATGYWTIRGDNDANDWIKFGANHVIEQNDDANNSISHGTWSFGKYDKDVKGKAIIIQFDGVKSLEWWLFTTENNPVIRIPNGPLLDNHQQ